MQTAPITAATNLHKSTHVPGDRSWLISAGPFLNHVVQILGNVQIFEMDAFQSHRKTLTYQRTCRQNSQLVYPIIFSNVPHFFCSPLPYSRMVPKLSGSKKSAQFNFAKICTKSAHFENLHISRKVEFPRPACSRIVHNHENVKLQKHNLCFENNNYVLRMQPAPTTAATNLHKTIYMLDQCKNVQIFEMCRFCAEFSKICTKYRGFWFIVVQRLLKLSAIGVDSLSFQNK